jgi:hypothetical protein
MPGIDMG